MSIRSDSIPFVFPLAVVAALLAALGSPLAALPAGLAVAVAAFFRDPMRFSNTGPETLLSPADGRVLGVDALDDGSTAITIFLSLLNVHVARSPANGTLAELTPKGGGFAAAYSPKADRNSRVEMIINTPAGRVGLTLFAGLVARRVLPWVSPPSELYRGQRIAIIRFGSRARVVVPTTLAPTVATGDRVLAGASPIAHPRQEATT